MLRTRSSRQLFASLALIALLPAATLAEELGADFIAAHADAAIARVLYKGNARTRDSAIAELTGIKAGSRLADIDPDKVRQSLLLAGIFSEASLSAEIDEEGQAIVTVAVREKWTFIPIPSGSYGSGGWSAGLDLLEYNFLGMRKTLVIGGSDSNLGLSGTIAYIDPRLLGKDASLKAYAAYANSEEEAHYMDDSMYASFTSETAKGGLALAYPAEGRFSADIGFIAKYKRIDGAKAEEYGLPAEDLLLIAGVDLMYDGQLLTGYHKSGPTATLTYLHGFDLLGLAPYDSFSLQAEIKLGTFWDGLADFGAVGNYSTRASLPQGTLSGPGYRTLPQGSSYSADNAALYASFDLPFVRASWAVMTLGAFYEGGLYATGLSGEKVDLFHGPGLGYRLYLHDIALPAVGIDAAYNIPAKDSVFSVSAGVSL